MSADLISSLPDSLLHHILTFLEMDQAVRTSILSKRWQFLWTCMPDFTFYDEYETLGFIGPGEFVAQVNKTLLLRRPGNLNKLVVEFEYDSLHASDVDVWIRFAKQRNVKNLELRLITDEISSRYNYSIPQYLYRDSSLINLVLSYVRVLPGGVVSWSSLKSLTLEYLQLTEEGISKILSGSPALEFLMMYEFRFDDCLKIHSKSLKDLVIQTYYHHQDQVSRVLEISAPNLQSLYVKWSLGCEILQLMDVSSLVSAYIDLTSAFDVGDKRYAEQISEDADKLLLSLGHVKELELGSFCIQGFSQLESKTNRLLNFPWREKVKEKHTRNL